ncbi:MAG: rhodanese-like domain-containing protein [Pseudomonadota bacterium]
MALRFAASILLAYVAPCFASDIPNLLIDYKTFQTNVREVGEIRGSRRVTESEFMRMSGDPSTVILDARSAEKFALLHIRGSTNLSLPDMTEDELARVIPSKTTRVLIYCNNNFLNEPKAFPSKVLTASLNVYTYNVLYSYGYTNIYELGPLLDIRDTKLAFEGTRNTAALQAFTLQDATNLTD